MYIEGMGESDYLLDAFVASTLMANEQERVASDGATTVTAGQLPKDQLEATFSEGSFSPLGPLKQSLKVAVEEFLIHLGLWAPTVEEIEAGCYHHH